MRTVLVDGAPHRRFYCLRRVEADVPLIEPERILDAVHHVADANDAGEGNAVEIFAHRVRSYQSRRRSSPQEGPVVPSVEVCIRSDSAAAPQASVLNTSYWHTR